MFVIIGAGLSGLTLGCALAAAGRDVRIVERRSHEDVLEYAQAAPDVVLDTSTLAALRDAGLDELAALPATARTACELRVDDRTSRVELPAPPGAPAAQQLVAHHVLYAALLEGFHRRGGQLDWSSTAIQFSGLRPTPMRSAAVVVDGPQGTRVVGAHWILAADGAEGLGRYTAVIAGVRMHEPDHGAHWLSLLTAAAPPSTAPLYATSPRGFAAQIPHTADTTRFVLEVRSGDTLEDWDNHRIWAELDARLAHPGAVERGAILGRVLHPVQSSYVEPLRVGQLLLVGAAAHVVPALTGKEGPLALTDALGLAEALTAPSPRPDRLGRWARESIQRRDAAQRVVDELLELTHRRGGDAQDAEQGAGLHAVLDDPDARAAFAARFA